VDGLATPGSPLTSGGRPQVGEGFGIPLVIRYVLEVPGSSGGLPYRVMAAQVQDAGR
jgi:hypothetical protein